MKGAALGSGEAIARHSLLTDRLLTVDRGERVSLPELFAALSRGEVHGFPRLRAHQRTAWHMFRVQLAALALDRAGRTDLPEAAEEWAALLRALSTAESGAEGDEPWCLAVADRSKPAFLQPPDPGGLKWSDVATPDALDLLITARNHDLKSEVAIHAVPEDWIYALVSLQTMEGYGGGGGRLKGIARMTRGTLAAPFWVSSRRGTMDRWISPPGGAETSNGYFRAGWTMDGLPVADPRSCGANLGPKACLCRRKRWILLRSRSADGFA
jgi:hypothetical protein